MIYLFLATAMWLSGSQTTVGAPLPPFSLPDQHGTVHAFEPGTRFVILSFEKKIAARVNGWLQKKPAEFLKEQKTVYIVEISPMPKVIAKKLAVPKMRKYPHIVLIADDASYRKTYPMNDGMATVLKLDPAGVVLEIQFTDDMVKLEGLVTAP